MKRSNLLGRILNAAVLIVFAAITVFSVFGLGEALTGGSTLPELLGLAFAASLSGWVLFRAVHNLYA